MIQGLQKTSLVDYPGHIVSTIFYGGCSMRCPFCHNPELVLGTLPKFDENEIMKHLIRNKQFIDGICITGGEPTLYLSLTNFLTKIKALGLKVKLDTNGTNPDMLINLIEKGLVDYVAMDIKSCLDKYKEACGSDIDLKKIQESVEILKSSKIDYEFRTTVVPGIFDKNVLIRICQWLQGSKRYFIQQFENKNELMNSELNEVKPFLPEDIRKFVEIAKPHFRVCEARNI